MAQAQDQFGIIRGKGTPGNETVITVALVNLLIEKGVITAEELKHRMEEIRRETGKSDPYGKPF